MGFRDGLIGWDRMGVTAGIGWYGWDRMGR
jgi:hypothetical protein